MYTFLFPLLPLWNPQHCMPNAGYWSPAMLRVLRGLSLSGGMVCIGLIALVGLGIRDERPGLIYMGLGSIAWILTGAIGWCRWLIHVREHSQTSVRQHVAAHVDREQQRAVERLQRMTAIPTLSATRPLEVVCASCAYDLAYLQKEIDIRNRPLSQLLHTFQYGK